MKIQTANVFVGFGEDVINKILEDDFKYSNLIDELNKNPNAGFLFSTQNNPNFISLEHTGGLGETAPTITLKVIDPLGELEKRFISYNVIDALIDKNATSLIEYLTESNLNVSENRQIRADAAYINALNRAITKGTLRKIYISYGLGQNIEDWAGPFQVHLMSGKIEFDGSKVLTLVFSPTNANTDSNQVIDAKGNIAIGKPAQKKIQILGYGSLNLRLYKELEGDPRNINYHDLLVTTLINYVQKASQVDNAIVLLPNINVICKNFIDSIIDQESYSMKNNQATRAAGLAGNRSFSTFNSLTPSNQIQRKAINLKIIKRVFAEFGLELVYSDTAWESAYTSIVTGKESSDKDDNIDLNTRESVIDLFESRGIFLRASSDSETYKDPNDFLKQIINKINKKIDNFSQIEYESKTEFNSKYLRYWRTLGENSKRIFIREFTAGNQNFSTNEVTIVGDRTLIYKVLYPKSKNIKKELAAYPLEKMDADILLNDAYINKMLKLSKRLGADTFKLFYVPDDYALTYSDDANQFKKDIQEQNVPIFRYNTKNSNVESIVFNESISYFTLLNTVASTYITTKASKSIREKELSLLKEKGIKNLDELLFFIKNTLSLFDNNPLNAEELFNSLDPSYRGDFSLEQFQKLLTGWIKRIEEDSTLLPKIPLSQFVNADKNVIYMDLIRKISQLSFQVEITTLPYFQLSNLSNINKSCLLFCQTSNIIQNRKNLPKRINSLGTGIYALGRFKHIISHGSASQGSAEDCKSIFTLMKINLQEDSGKLPKATKENKETQAILDRGINQ